MNKKIILLLCSMCIPLLMMALNGEGTYGSPYYGTLDSYMSITENVYFGNSNLVILSGGVLDVEAGTNLIFISDYEIQVNGTGQITASGSPGNFIRFTCDYDGDGIFGESGEYWDGIEFSDMDQSAPVSDFSFCIIEFCSGSSYEDGAGLEVTGYDGISLQDCILQYNHSYDNGGGIGLYESDITINDTQIINNSASDCGGGMYIYSSCPYIDGIIMNNNIAYDYGAGICALYSIFEINNLDSNDNNGDRGGSFYLSSSTLTINNATISNNQAEYGAGFYLYSNSSLHLANTIVSNNYSSINGGGFYIGSDSELNISNVSIYQNSASSYGGGIYSGSNNIYFNSIDKCNIYLNHSSIMMGMDICLSSGVVQPISVIVDTFTVSNPSNYYASPIDLFSFSIDHSHFNLIVNDIYVSPEGNNENSGLSPDDPFETISYALSMIYADDTHQGIIHLDDGFYFSDNFPVSIPDYISIIGTSKENTILNGSGSSSLFDCVGNSTQFSTFTIDNCGASSIKIMSCDNVYINNVRIMNSYSGYSSDGGGVYIENSSVDLHNSSFICNNSYDDGGGICINNSTISLTNCDFIGNLANDEGGGLFSYNSRIHLNQVNFQGNTADDGAGTYTYGNFGDTSNRFFNCCFEDNSADNYGGGLSIRSNFSLSNSTFNNNTSNSKGGAIYLYSGYSDTLTCLHLLDNTSNDGGAMYINGSPILQDVRLFGNGASNDGGGIYFNNAITNLHRAVIHDNSCEHKGGGLYAKESTLGLINNTIYDNIAEEYMGAGASMYDNCSIAVVNSIVCDEISFSTEGVESDMVAAFSDFPQGQESILTLGNCSLDYLGSNISVNPQFIDSENDCFLLNTSSPCIDSGTQYFVYQGIGFAELTDEEIFGPYPDMGACEYGLTNFDEIIINEPFGSSKLVNNHPNPFNPVTQIDFFLTETCIASISIYNIKGQVVKNFTKKRYSQGLNSVIWNGRNNANQSISSGIYFYKLFVNEVQVSMKKCMLLK